MLASQCLWARRTAQVHGKAKNQKNRKGEEDFFVHRGNCNRGNTVDRVNTVNRVYRVDRVITVKGINKVDACILCLPCIPYLLYLPSPGGGKKLGIRGQPIEFVFSVCIIDIIGNKNLSHEFAFVFFCEIRVIRGRVKACLLFTDKSNEHRDAEFPESL